MLRHFETKKIAIYLLLLALAVFILPQLSIATDYSSSSFVVKDPVVDSGSQGSSSTNFGLGQSVSQVAIGQSTSASFQLWSGFQYYYRINANTLTATAGDASVALSWTVPVTYLGIAVASYEVGIGTTSGSYSFTNVGNVTSYTASSLTNGTPYFFITKALDASGNFLVFSNEATATPTGASGGGGGGGGGGGIYGNSSIVFEGTAYPNSTVSVVYNTQVAATAVANSLGNFSITLTNIAGGAQTFTLYAFDSESVKSANLNLSANMIFNTTTTLNNLIIAPTLSSSHKEIKKGEMLTLRGYSAPAVPILISFSGVQSFNANVQSSVTGFYSYSFNTNNYVLGEYQAIAKSKVFGVDSPPSLSASFKIGEETVVTPPGECKRSDLNCDGRVNLIDFSILLYFWDSTEFSKNPRVDIDRSGHIGLRDLSIMLYDWTG